MDDATLQFCEMTGADPSTGQMFMEMSGGNMETAVALYFDNNNTTTHQHFDNMGGGIATASDGGGGGNEGKEDDWMKRIWDGQEVPPAWSNQSLAFEHKVDVSDDSPAAAFAGIGIVQPKGGPCGLLAAFQGVLVGHLMRTGKLKAGLVPSPDDIATTIATILIRASTSEGEGGPDKVHLASWENGVSSALLVREVDASDSAAVTAACKEQLTLFAQEGGALLLLYSLVLTHGVERLRRIQLISGPFSICSMALVNLILVGIADDNAQAYNSMGVKVAWPVTPDVGLLSLSEIDTKVPIRDELKSPKLPVWVVHGNDHFTLAFASDEASAKSALATEGGSKFTLVHWNGLPPDGPRLVACVVDSPSGAVGKSAASAAEGVAQEYKPVVGAIDSIIEPRRTDKDSHPKEWTKWTFEVALVVDDPTNKSPERPVHLPGPQVFELGQPDHGQAWRCRKCYETRFKTMCFGLNDAGAAQCRHCSRARQECGWTLWKPYSELPKGWQGSMDRRYGPKIVTALRTKWKKCNVEFSTPDNPPSI